MSKRLSKMIVIVSATMISGAAIADQLVAGYIDDRSPNPEQETFAYPARAEGQHLIGFVGPARKVGADTGNAESDTFAYRPLVAVQDNGFWSFQIVQR